jgi:hypothetical protein
MAKSKQNGKRKDKNPKPKIGTQIGAAINRGDMETVATLLKQWQQQNPQQPKPNAEAPPVIMAMQLEDVPITVGSAICPGCNAPMVKQPLSSDVVVKLRAGQKVKATCANCGQRQITQTQGEAKQEDKRIITPREGLVLKRRGM